MRRSIAAATLIGYALCASAETAFVIDQLFVGVHQDRALDSPIIKVLPSGTPLEVLARDGEFAWVQMEDGAAGWVDVSYLMADKPAKLALAERETEFSGAENEMTELQVSVAAAQTSKQETEAALANIQTELDSVHAELGDARAQAATLQNEAGSAQSELNNTLAELTQTRTALANAQTDLSAARDELAALRSELSAALATSKGSETQREALAERAKGEVTALESRLAQSEARAAERIAVLEQRLLESEAKVADGSPQQAHSGSAATATAFADGATDPISSGERWALSSSKEKTALQALQKELEATKRDNRELESELAKLEQETTRAQAQRVATAPGNDPNPPRAAVSKQPYQDESSTLDQYTRILRWEPWEQLLLASSLLLAFALGAYFIDYRFRQRHGGFRV